MEMFESLINDEDFIEKIAIENEKYELENLVSNQTINNNKDNEILENIILDRIQKYQWEQIHEESRNLKRKWTLVFDNVDMKRKIYKKENDDSISKLKLRLQIGFSNHQKKILSKCFPYLKDKFQKYYLKINEQGIIDCVKRIINSLQSDDIEKSLIIACVRLILLRIISIIFIEQYNDAIKFLCEEKIIDFDGHYDSFMSMKLFPCNKQIYFYDTVQKLYYLNNKAKDLYGYSSHESIDGMLLVKYAILNTIKSFKYNKYIYYKKVIMITENENGNRDYLNNFVNVLIEMFPNKRKEINCKINEIIL